MQSMPDASLKHALSLATGLRIHRLMEKLGPSFLDYPHDKSLLEMNVLRIISSTVAVLVACFSVCVS